MYYLQFFRLTLGVLKDMPASLEELTRNTLVTERFPSMHFYLPGSCAQNYCVPQIKRGQPASPRSLTPSSSAIRHLSPCCASLLRTRVWQAVHRAWHACCRQCGFCGLLSGTEPHLLVRPRGRSVSAHPGGTCPLVRSTFWLSGLKREGPGQKVIFRWAALGPGGLACGSPFLIGWAGLLTLQQKRRDVVKLCLTIPQMLQHREFIPYACKQTVVKTISI